MKQIFLKCIKSEGKLFKRDLIYDFTFLLNKYDTFRDNKHICYGTIQAETEDGIKSFSSYIHSEQLLNSYMINQIMYSYFGKSEYMFTDINKGESVTEYATSNLMVEICKFEEICRKHCESKLDTMFVKMLFSSLKKQTKKEMKKINKK